MKYQIHKLDGRYSYNRWFKYYIGFSNRMSNSQGPIEFNNAMKWFFKTYGWSAEVRQYEEIYSWSVRTLPLISVKGGWLNRVPKDLPDDCNPSWSWTNGYNDLRIYVKDDPELAFFQLAFKSE